MSIITSIAFSCATDNPRYTSQAPCVIDQAFGLFIRGTLADIPLYGSMYMNMQNDLPRANATIV